MQFANDDEYNRYLLDVLTRIQSQIAEQRMDALMNSMPEMEVIGPRGTGSTVNFAPGVGSDTSEGKELARFDTKMYSSVNHMMPKWFTEMDNKMRRLDNKLQKYDGRRLADKLGNALRKPERWRKKVKKRLKKALGF